jgi:hypothetical protein
MNKKLLLCFFLFILAVGNFATQKASAAQIDELIIMVPDAEKGRNDRAIKNALLSIPGVDVVGYCNSQKCFYLHVDRTLQPNNDNIFTAIRSLGYGMDLKLEGTIQQAQSNCTDRTE